MNAPEKISIKDKGSVQVVKTGDNIQIWRQTVTYNIPELLNRKANLVATIILLNNSVITDAIIQILDKICSETMSRRDVEHTKTLKENVIIKLQKEVDDIEWLNRSSSSSSCSSSSESLDNKDKDKKSSSSSSLSSYT